MLTRAVALLEQAEVDGIERVDVPGRGAGEESDGALRAEVEPMVPAMQSGSLFGGRRGLLVVDAHQFLKAEAEIAADLVTGLVGDAVVVCFVASGSLPSPLAKAVKAQGETVSIRQMRERDATGWAVSAARDRRIRLSPEAAAALVQRFGTDTAALGRALDQLAAIEGEVTAEDIISRFRNRPDEPMWLLSDAVSDGDIAQSLRRLSDFLTHGHPLQLIAFLAGDLRRRAMAAAAPDVTTLAEWLGARPDHFPVKKAWQARNRVHEADLRRAVDALARADIAMKTMPESTHRATMERLTVALCRWYGTGRRSA
jgi:DNA polymerase-3 subunit delta